MDQHRLLRYLTQGFGKWWGTLRSDSDLSAQEGQRLCKDQRGVLCLHHLKKLNMQMSVNWRQTLIEECSRPAWLSKEHFAHSISSSQQLWVLQGAHSRGPSPSESRLAPCWRLAPRSTI